MTSRSDIENLRFLYRISSEEDQHFATRDDEAHERELAKADLDLDICKNDLPSRPVLPENENSEKV